MAGEVGGHVGRADGHTGIARDRRHPKVEPAGASQLAPIEVFVKMLEQPHIGERIERGAAREHQSIAFGGADKVSDHVDERVLEHHLRCGGLVETLLRILLVTDVFDAKDRIRVPHILLCNRFAENAGECVGIGIVPNIALPIREVAIEKNLSVGREIEDRLQCCVIRVRFAVIIAVGGGAHVATFAGEPGPAALRRADHRIENAERVENAVVAVNAPHAAVLADVQRYGAHVAEPVEHRHHCGLLVARKRRRGERKPRMIIVMRRANQRDRLAKPEMFGDVARRTHAAIDSAQIECGRVLFADQTETCRRLVKHNANQCRPECHVIP